VKRVTLTQRLNRNWLEQDGRVVTGFHAGPLTDKGGGIITEVILCDHANIEEFCVHVAWGELDGVSPHRRYAQTRAIPLDLLYNVLIEEI
jgi:hypothetical protein